MQFHQEMTPYWKRQLVEKWEAEGRAHLRKITSQADNRMRERTAKEQHADALRELNRGPDDVVPDADDSSIQRGMLT